MSLKARWNAWNRRRTLPAPGLRRVGCGPLPLPGEKARAERAQQHADAVMQALADLRINTE